MQIQKRNVSFITTIMASLTDKELRKTYADYYQDYAPLTSEIGIPALVIAAENDYSTGTKMYKTFAFPQQKTILLPGGAFAFYEQKEKVLEAICGFVK